MLDATGLPRGSAVTCNNVVTILIAMYSTVFKSHFTETSDAAQWRACKTWNPKDLRLLVRAPGAPLFFFQQCSPVGIAIFTGEDSQSE